MFGTRDSFMDDTSIVQGNLRIEPPEIVIDDVSQCTGEVRETVTLFNDGETDEIIERTITTCGCAQVELPSRVLVPAGGSLTLPIRISPWGSPRRKAHRTRFILGENRVGPLLRLDITINSALRTIPSALQEFLHPEGLIRVLSPDQTVISFLGVEPQIPISTLETEGTEIGVFVEWDALAEWAKTDAAKNDQRVRYNENGEWDSITIELLTDHPACEHVIVDLFNVTYVEPAWR